MLMNKVFKTFFNRYDLNGNLHTGFVQSMDLSNYSDITFLNDLTATILDSFLFNELSNRIVLDRWKNYLKWNYTEKRFDIDANFYNDAVVSLYAYLLKQEKINSIIETDFKSLSAQETETINYGEKLTSKAYGAQNNSKAYGKIEIEISKGAETESKGAHTDTENKGAHTDTENKGTYTDSETIGQQTNTNTKTDSIYPFDANDFVNDSKSEESTINGAQNNSTIHGAQSNSNVYGSQENSKSYGAQSNTRTYGKTTNETKERTDTETKGTHTDSETITAHIDSKTKTKVILLSPEKYFDIQKELAEKNIYTLFSQAVDECFLNNNFMFSTFDRWGCIL